MMFAQIGEVLGNLDLGRVKDFLEMTDAKRLVRKQMEDAQPGFIAETFINFDQAHLATLYTHIRIYVNKHITASTNPLARVRV
jgi:hypothetical protein